MKKILSLVVAAGVLSGCAHSSSSNASLTNPAPGVVNQAQINNQIQMQLQQAAMSTQASLAELAAIEKLQYQSNLSVPLQDIHDSALEAKVAVKWYGPIQPLLSEVAVATGYKLQVFGKPPILPVLVNIDSVSTPASAIDILRNADLQAGLKVAILVFPSQKIISLRYTGS